MFPSVVLILVLVNSIQKNCAITKHCWQLGVLPTTATKASWHWLVYVLSSAFLFVLVLIVLH